MPNLTSQLIVRLIDGVTGPARNAANSLRGIGAAARSLNGAGLAGMQQRFGAAISANNEKLAIMRGRLFDAAAGAWALHRALAPTIGTAVDFETTLEDIGQKADLSGDKLKALGKQIREIGKATNQGAMGVGQGVDFLIGMGLGGKTDEENVAASLDMATPIGKAATAFRAQFEDLAKAAHAAFLNLKVPADQMILAFDTMAKAGQLGGFELKDMAKWFPGLGAAGQFLGSKGVEGVADFAAALQIARTGAQDADQAANNLMNFLQKFTLKETVKNFKDFGVDIYKELDYARKKGISPIEHMMNVLKKVTKGDADLVTQIFGDKQVLEFIRPMWANMERYREIRAEALKSQGYTEEMFQRRMQTSQAALDRFRVSVESLQISIGSALLPALNEIIDAVAPIIHQMAAWAEANPRVTATIIALTAGLVGLRIAGIAAAFAGRLGYGGLLMLGYGATGALRAVAALARAPFAVIAAALTHLTGVIQIVALRFAMMMAAFRAGSIGIGGILAGIAATGSRALLALLNPMALVRAALVALRVALISSGIGAALVAIAMAGLWIYNNWQGIKELFAGFADALSKGLGPAKGFLQPIADLAVKIYEAIDGLTGPLAASNAEWRAWGETIGGAVASAINTVANGISRIVGLFSSAVDKAYALGAALSNLNPFGGGEAPAKPATGAGGAGSPQPGAGGRYRAAGGRVTRGAAYVVGERRPEVFEAPSDGYIHKRVPAGGGGVQIGSISIPIEISGVPDPRAAAEEAYRLFESRARDLFRGVFADTGATFGGA